MDERDLEIISAFADGESVDTGHLVEALENPAGHAALLDFLRMRETVERDPRRPSPEMVVALSERLERRIPWWRRAILVPAAVPAGLGLLLALFLSFWLALNASVQTPQPLAETALEETVAANPPTPDRVLRFEEGVDWLSQ